MAILNQTNNRGTQHSIGVDVEADGKLVNKEIDRIKIIKNNAMSAVCSHPLKMCCGEKVYAEHGFL